MARPEPRERFPALARLCGAYLHEDLAVTDGSPEAAVARFAREVPPALRERWRRDLRDLLAAARGERALDAALAALGCAHRPRGRRRALRRFLERVGGALTPPR